jgi:hypothetical protein
MKILVVIWQAALAGVVSAGASSGPVFPAPRQIEVRGQGLKLTESIPILLPPIPLLRTCFWARSLIVESCSKTVTPHRRARGWSCVSIATSIMFLM